VRITSRPGAGGCGNFQAQLSSLHAISAEIAGLHELAAIHDQALGYCLDLTGLQFAFTGLLRDTDNVGGRDPGDGRRRDQGFRSQPEFYEMFRLMRLRPSVVGVVIQEDRSYLANDVVATPTAWGSRSATRRCAGSLACRCGWAPRSSG
jgi:hypothetical protein